MSCPHSTAKGSSPQTCSLCLGAVPKIVRITSDSVVTLDGVSQGRLGELNKERQHQETQEARPIRRRICSRCEKPGHNARTCKVEAQNVPDFN